MTADFVDITGTESEALGAGDVNVRTRTSTRHLSKRVARYLPLAPFFAYVALGILVPAIAIFKLAFSNTKTGAATWSNFQAVFTQHQYLYAFEMSMKLSVVSAIVPAVLGTILAYVIATSRFRTLKRLVSTGAGVLANFGGVNLAFLFIALAGPAGLLVDWMDRIGVHNFDRSTQLFSFNGVAIVYLYFQIPLMVLVITPALTGLNPAWREASSNLGANYFQYWRKVGLPVLMPSLLSSSLLLFGSALAAYATTEALTGGLLALMPIQIGDFFGNVLATNQNVAYALASIMIAIILIVMVPYVFLQRRLSRWSR
jgi:putative spermidine/putrescine transport system permease protein